jgi:transglutaminase-like putative cysteine protease
MHQRLTLPSGSLGTLKTVDLMARAAMGKWGAHSPRIRSLAIRIVRDAGAGEKDKLAEVRAIHEWTKRHLRYVNDPLWQETISHPEHLAFVQRDGDCDDHAVLEAALLGSIGIKTRFVTVAPKPGPPTHVYLQALLGSGDGLTADSAHWINLDPIVKNQPAGWAVPNPASLTLHPINTPDGIGLQSTGSLVATLAGIAGVLRWMP